MLDLLLSENMKILNVKLWFSLFKFVYIWNFVADGGLPQIICTNLIDQWEYGFFFICGKCTEIHDVININIK